MPLYACEAGGNAAVFVMTQTDAPHETVSPPTCDDCPRKSGAPANEALSVGATHDCRYEKKRKLTMLHWKDERSSLNLGFAERKRHLRTVRA